MAPSIFSQAFPPAPTFTEKNLESLSGKVFIVTGSASGIGFELAKMLYAKDGTVYIAARSEEKIVRAIKALKAELPLSSGRLIALSLDLADLSTIKSSADDFLSKEERLDVLFHNAGVMMPPAGSKTKLGHDLEMGTNCLGPFLFNHFLEPILKRTASAKESQHNTIRIVWLSSMINVSTPRGGILWDDETGKPKVLKAPMENYMESKVGNVFLASEAAVRLGEAGIISMSVHPGLLRTELQRHLPPFQRLVMSKLLKPPKYGAYSELFAALSPAITPKHNGGFIVPWGRFGAIPLHIAEGLKSKNEGGTGAAERFWEYCFVETRQYM